jgi:thioredoxin 1
MGLIPVTAENFKHEVSACEQIIALFFTAGWCGTSHILVPILREFIFRFQGRVKFCCIDIDDSPEIVSRYGVNEIPAILFLFKGKIVDHFIGIFSQADIEHKLDALVQITQSKQ